MIFSSARLQSIEKAITSKEWILLAIIFIVNVVWRTIMLDFNSIYLDEAQTMFQIMRPVERIVNGYAKDQQNAPLYFIILHFWVKLIGLSVFKVRLFSAICFSGAAVIFYKIVKTHFGFYYGIASVFLFLLSRDLLGFSHEARGYALISLLATSSFYVFSQLMIAPSNRRAVFLGLINLALIYTHYLTIYLFVVQGISSLLFFSSNRKGFWQYALSQVAVILLFVPWLRVVFSVMPEMGTFWIAKSTWPTFQNIFISIAEARFMAQIALGIMGAGILWWAITLKRRTKNENKIFILFLLWGLGVFTMHYITGKFKPVFIYKYALYGTIGFLILFVAVVKTLPIGNWLRAGVLIYAVVWYSYRFRFETPKMEDWKAAMAYVTKKKTDDNLLILQASYTYKCFAAYYDLELFDEPREMKAALKETGVYPVSTVPGAIKVLKKNQPEEIIIMRAHWRSVDRNGDMKSLLDSSYVKIQDSFSTKGVDVHIYRTKTNSSQDEVGSF